LSMLLSDAGPSLKRGRWRKRFLENGLSQSMSSEALGRVLRSFSLHSTRLCLAPSSYARIWGKLEFQPSSRKSSFHQGLSRTRYLQARESVEARSRVSGLR